MKVLIVTDHFLPGYRMGGPVRSLAAILSNLRGHIDFSVLTRSNDLGETNPMPGIDVNDWNNREGVQVYYSSRPLAAPRLLRRILRETAPDILYLNSFFSTTTVCALLFRHIRLLPRLPVLVAPRGEFSKGALGLGAGKKRAYIRFARRSGMLNGLAWHASSKAEAEDLTRAIPEAAMVHIAPNLLYSSDERVDSIDKRPGEVSLVFIARISPMKNLLAAIRYLERLTGKVAFHIYGPLEDRPYWEACLAAATQLPENVTFSYKGELPHHKVAETLRQHHFMFLPTLGENFGHSIAEALQQGRPVLISDRTPWRDLQSAGVGWDLSLDDDLAWDTALATCVEMDNAAYRSMSQKAQGFAQQWVEQQGGRDANLRMFRSVAKSIRDA